MNLRKRIASAATAVALAATLSPVVTQAPAEAQMYSGVRAIAARQISGSEMRALNALWNRESGWRVHAYNPSSGAYGIPQALPGRKMASAGPAWRDSARVQIRWGLRYIHGRYGSCRNAWRHWQTHHWY